MRLVKSCFAVLIAAELCICPAAAGQIDTILSGAAKGAFTPAADVNVTQKAAMTPVRIAGRTAIRFDLDYAWAGGDLDWIREGVDKPGFAQRIQYQEKPKAWMQAGREYWYTASFLLPSSVARVSGYTLSTMDFKHHVNGHGSVPSVSFNFVRGNFMVVESLDSAWNCGAYRNVDGGQTAACDRTDTAAALGSQAHFSNRWVQMVAHMRWAGEGGFFDVWIDGHPIFGFAGNTLQSGREVQFKFGPYRHHMTGDPGNAEIFYAGVAKASSCEGLGIANCDTLAAHPPRAGFQSVTGKEHWVATDLRDHR
jgi:hypothetical protein